MKHPDQGNTHFPTERQAELEAKGWVRWPRTKEQKQNIKPIQDPEPIKRGRPKSK